MAVPPNTWSGVTGTLLMGVEDYLNQGPLMQVRVVV
jgi:hypothetical protein